MGGRRLSAGPPLSLSHPGDRGFPYSKVDYPALKKIGSRRVLIKVNGVFAGTNNHYGRIRASKSL